MCQKCLCTAYPFKVPPKIWPKTYVTATHQNTHVATEGASFSAVEMRDPFVLKCNHNVVLCAYIWLFFRKCDFAGLFCVPL